MSNFMFSLNATLPVFLVIVLGWFLMQKKMFNENFVDNRLRVWYFIDAVTYVTAFYQHIFYRSVNRIKVFSKRH